MFSLTKSSLFTSPVHYFTDKICPKQKWALSTIPVSIGGEGKRRGVICTASKLFCLQLTRYNLHSFARPYTMLCEKFLWAIKSCFVKFSFKPLNHALWNLICKISKYALWNSLWVPKVCLKTYFVGSQSMLFETSKYALSNFFARYQVCFAKTQSMLCESSKYVLWNLFEEQRIQFKRHRSSPKHQKRLTLHRSSISKPRKSWNKLDKGVWRMKNGVFHFYVQMLE